jgi:cell shape-determining protein MreC
MKSSRQFVPARRQTTRTYVVIGAVILVLIFAIPYTRRAVRSFVADVGVGVARVTHSSYLGVASIGTGFRSKRALVAQNTMLQGQVDTLQAELNDRNLLASQNADLKATLGRKDAATQMTLAAVIDKPTHSAYDTLLIDGGARAGFLVDQIAYANGETPIGTIAEVMANTAVVRLYSAPGQTLEARLAPLDIDVTLTGRGGGNFSATIPHDAVITSGAVVTTKEINPRIVADYQKVTSDSRDPFQTLLLSAPVNMNELSFVEVGQ